MPKVPTAQQAGIGSLSTNPVNVRQNITVPNGAFGGKSGSLGRFGNSLINASATLSKNAARLQEQEDQNASIEAITSSSNDINKLLNDGDNGVFAQKGKNAVGIYNRTEKTLDEYENQYLSSLANENQKQKLKKSLQ